VIDEVQSSDTPIILFIDEAHTLIGAGGAAGTGDAANLLKPALARGELRTIAATTWAEYKQHIEKDPALTRRFQVVKVEEPSEESAIRMLRGIAGFWRNTTRSRSLTRRWKPPSGSRIAIFPTGNCPTRRSASSTRPAHGSR
jgi:type VI secretion system protein VasG